MGNCYSVRLKISKADEKRAFELLKKFIDDNDGKGVFYSTKPYNFCLDSWEKDEGIKPDSFDNVIRMMLAGWKCWDYRVEKHKTYAIYSNGFDASYGWEMVMQEMFKAMIPAIGDKSAFWLDMDEGAYKMYIKDGKVAYKDIRR